MIGSVKHGFVLLSNPKTGSSALESAFSRYCPIRIKSPPNLKHISYKQFRRMFSQCPELLDCAVYAVVREPVEHLFSWYRYRARAELADPNSPRHERYTGGISFLRFAEEWNSEDPPLRARVGSGVDWCLDAEGRAFPMRIFDYTNINGLYEVLASHLGVRPEFKRVNASPAMPVAFDRDEIARLPRMRRALELYAELPRE